MSTDLLEHSPLSHLDELPIHQTTAPIRLVEPTDLRAFERYWFTAQDDDGEFFIVTGLGTYPNVGTVDAYALIVIDGKQTTVRAHRPMSQDRADMNVGPIRFELVDAFREWRLQLNDNAQDFTFDLRWRDTKRAMFARVPDVTVPGMLDWRLLHDWGGYETFGRISGTVRYRGRTITLDGTRTRGSRDHHWGTRDGVAGYSIEHTKPFKSYKGESLGFSHFGQWIEFQDWSIWGARALYNIGDLKHPGTTPITAIEQKLRFDPITRHLIGGITVHQFPDGTMREVRYEPLGHLCAYLRTAGYTGCNGRGTPDGDFHHGVPVGELVSGETYDITDPKVCTEIEGFENRPVRATCDGETTIGILESRNPAIHAMASRNVFYSILDEGTPGAP